ncbi:YXWGXW repeat-containing protein [Variovorax sp. J2P1-59]|uniref:YXWGXW repeat-containing protein n=1 Tax=Variovorax flavidus TaxID=3053501 RepID=UPI002574B1BD|nr:YXWGXW repeat-containing protein [Variovorax sp. J2P1-59]MDM0078302.1 YXWGXW repeat-containing protein [Variovorax sp. J2P1-59]
MKKLAVTFAMGAASLLSLGAVMAPTVAQAQAVVSVRVAPPPARYERVPPPRPGYVWAPGHYEWNHGRYVWNRGNWMRAREGYAYRAPQWQERGGHWEYQAGRWDNDHDGVPNRYDRKPNNPSRS